MKTIDPDSSSRTHELKFDKVNSNWLTGSRGAMGKVRSGSRRGNGELVRHRSSRRGARAAAKPSDLLSSKVIRLANVLRRSSTLVYGRRFGLLAGRMAHRCAGRGARPGHAQRACGADGSRQRPDVTRRERAGRTAPVLREYRREGLGIRITLSAAARRGCDDLMSRLSSATAVLFHGMSAAEKSEFFEILDRLTRLARTVLEREQNA